MKKATILIILVITAAILFGHVNKDNVFNSENIAIEELAEIIEEPAPATYGIFAPYNQESFELAKSGKIILFFEAPWCLSCLNFSEDVKKNVTKIPEDVSILSVDYDSNLELRAKYGVSQPHTFIQIKNDDKLSKKWMNSENLDSFLSQML